ncbi:ABC transporter substrate-binding protein [Paenarthrobacter ureafaciens]|uniref:ABC transporter substrate-binding protein n=1 Tax=Paenarthrobacter ureafaciens TaxID=37931 RepID=UPI0015BC3AFA|nr:ABC transporter substrate-binding protein [Paenarthrobacter ureafaciens]NWL27150.1 ABC transporter substrate-binding protein [Paenarthrobacter ureafaciens]
MNKCKVAFSVSVLAMAAAMALTGCVGETPTASGGAGSSNSLPEEIAASGKLRVGVSPDYPPMEFKESDNKLTGADIELTQKVGEILGVQVEFVESPFEQLINSIQTKRIDAAIGMSDSVERQKTLDFVDYFQAQARLYTSASRAGEFTKPSDTCGKTMAVASSSVQYQQAKDLSKTACTDKGLPAINVTGTDSGSAARLQIDQGRADLSAQDGENLAYHMKNEPGKFATVLEPLPAQPNGFVLAKGSDQLAAAVKEAFTKMKASGDYQKILDKWDIGYGTMDPAINSAK